MRRFQVTIRWLMLFIGCLAVFCFCLREGRMELLKVNLLLIVGSAGGAFIQRYLGGKGVLGGAIGGAATSFGIGILLCLNFYLQPSLNARIADPGRQFAFMTLWGAIVGFVVGQVIWRERRGHSYIPQSAVRVR